MLYTIYYVWSIINNLLYIIYYVLYIVYYIRYAIYENDMWFMISDIGCRMYDIWCMIHESLNREMTCTESQTNQRPYNFNCTHTPRPSFQMHMGLQCVHVNWWTLLLTDNTVLHWLVLQDIHFKGMCSHLVIIIMWIREKVVPKGGQPYIYIYI